MPIVDIQRRFRELGRIRTGEQIATGKTFQSGPKRGQPITRPAKLARFRLTSSWQHLIEQAAEVFGGTCQPWKNDGTGLDEFEVYVEVDSLPVVIPPGEVFDQWYELWDGKGLAKRCDGERQALVDRPCSCPADPMERQELAGSGKACKPTTRVRLMLPDVADVGIWRLESHGFHAAAEMGGAAGLIEAATRQGAMIPADLRLQSREGARRPGQPRKTFYVPAITFRGTLGPVLAQLGILEEGATMPRLLGVEPRPALDQGGSPALPAGGSFDPVGMEAASIPPAPTPDPPAPLPAPDDPGPGAPEPRGHFAPPAPGDDDPGSTVDPGPAMEPPPAEPEADPESFGSLTGPQMIAVRMKDAGITDRDEKVALVSAILGRPVTTTKDLTPAEVRKILAVLSSPTELAQHAATASATLAGSTAPPSAAAPPPARETRRPATPPPAAPIEATGAPKVATAPATDPATWDADAWRAFLRSKSVKVAAVLREANRIARERDTPPPGSLDDLAGSGIAGLLVGFVESEADGGQA